MADAPLARIRRICLALPDTRETLTWGKPHFRVGDKIFAGYGEEKGVPVLGFKLEREHAAAAIRDPKFWRAPYVGHKGWVSLDVTQVTDWDEVQGLIHESYQLIAPKRTLQRLLAGAAPPRSAAGKPARNPAKKKKKPSTSGKTVKRVRRRTATKAAAASRKPATSSGRRKRTPAKDTTAAPLPRTSRGKTRAVKDPARGSDSRSRSVSVSRSARARRPGSKPGARKRRP